MTPEEFEGYLQPGYEGRGYEFKGAFIRTDAVFFAKVTRAALSMANRRGGGLIFIGIDEGDDHAVVATGLTDEHVASWNYDDVSAGLAAAADPRIDVDLEEVLYDGKRFVVITVHEFEELPVICRRHFSYQGREYLRPGAIYVRSRGKPETVELPTQTETRELLDMAIDKGIQAFLARANRVGLGLPHEPQAQAAANAYQQERDEADA